jgi:hypothetical protein
MESVFKLDKFKDMIKEKTGFIDSARGGEEIITLCPWCEEKKFHKRVDHGHLYINLEMMKINCYKCSDGRGFIFKLFKQFKENPKDYVNDTSILMNWKNYVSTNRMKEKFETIEYKCEEQIDTTIKKQYLQQRLGAFYNFDRIDRLVYSIKNFIKENNLTVENNLIDYLDSNFIGVVGNRGSIINLRNIEESNIRYFNFPISKKTFFKDFYGIQTGPIRKSFNTVVLCEGIFDLLNAVECDKLSELKDESCFWACGFGTNYNNLLISVLDYIKLPRTRLVILSDSDLSGQSYIKMKENPFIDSLKIYWNNYKKDFGERPIEPISKIVF